MDGHENPLAPVDLADGRRLRLDLAGSGDPVGAQPSCIQCWGVLMTPVDTVR